MAGWTVVKKGYNYCVNGDAVSVELGDHMTAEEVAQVLYENGVLEREAVKGKPRLYNPSDLMGGGLRLVDENFYPHVSMVAHVRGGVPFPNREDIEKNTVCAVYWDETWVDRAAEYTANLRTTKKESSVDAVDAGVAVGVISALFNFFKK